MGGYGSTRWNNHIKKETVEACKELSIFELRRDRTLRENNHFVGTVTWTDSFLKKSDRIELEVCTLGDPFIRFSYALNMFGGSEKDFDYQFDLEKTSCNFGGSRWWIRCGLTTNDRYCGRRVGKVYLPPYGQYFGCRHCHNLTYKSVQERDKNGGLFTIPSWLH